ncbi:MAG: hypothetical protein H6835_14860 [Planctomycetes bacterium]|nr:hypothetical protein [Planctomycetota bacterium]
MPAQLPFPRPLAPALLLATIVTAQSEAPPSTPPTFAEHDAAWWEKRLGTGNRPAQQQLIDAGAEALPMLRWLLEHGNDYAAHHAAEAATALGAIAGPLQDALLAGLRRADDWWPGWQCASALAACGDRREETRELLLRHVCRGAKPQLRSICAAALARLDPDAGETLLTAAVAGRFADPAQAIATLAQLDEAVVPSLFAALDDDGERGRIAREAVVQIGWPVADRLTRADRADLAHRALTEGALHDIDGCQDYVVTGFAPEPPAVHLPDLRFACATEGAFSTQLWTGTESARGYHLRRIGFAASWNDERRTIEYHLVCEEATVPRQLALGMARQLAVLRRMQLEPKQGDRQPWTRTGTFLVDVQAHADGEDVLYASHLGGIASTNVTTRFRAEAARNVLLRLGARSEWTARVPDAADRAAVDAERQRYGEITWIGEHLTRLEELLKR